VLRSRPCAGRSAHLSMSHKTAGHARARKQRSAVSPRPCPASLDEADATCNARARMVQVPMRMGRTNDSRAAKPQFVRSVFAECHTVESHGRADSNCEM
jgi:hypothetical protein